MININAIEQAKLMNKIQTTTTKAHTAMEALQISCLFTCTHASKAFESLKSRLCVESLPHARVSQLEGRHANYAQRAFTLTPALARAFERGARECELLVQSVEFCASMRSVGNIYGCRLSKLLCNWFKFEFVTPARVLNG